MLVLCNHGSLFSCVGPIIDVHMRCSVFNQEKCLVLQVQPVFKIARDVFLPSVLDVVLVTRPTCNFRDGLVVKNRTSCFRPYLVEIPFNDGYLFGIIHLVPGNYRSTLHSLYRYICNEVCDLNNRDVLVGFASVFLFIKSYGNLLAAELSQLCYKGVLRTIALASTDGLCSWRCTLIVILQPVIVPVG